MLLDSLPELVLVPPVEHDHIVRNARFVQALREIIAPVQHPLVRFAGADFDGDRLQLRASPQVGADPPVDAAEAAVPFAPEQCVGGASESCTDIVPPGNDSCANAVEWGWCTADWIGDYCAATCGRCGSSSDGGTGAGTGGSATGGGSASPTGGTGSGDLSVPRLNGGQQATTTRYWDCCKPSCAWAGNVGGMQPATACGNDGNSTVGADAKNACESGGTAFQCNWGVPWQVGPSLSYGYVAFNSGGCGTCYQLDFPNGKTMIVQVINIGAMSGTNFDLLIPGGGVGAMNACTQNGTMWGNVDAGAQHGGFLATCGPNMSCITDMCQNAFGSNAALMAGCEWFTGWFGAQDNPNVTYAQTDCPAEITNKSGLR